MYIINYDFRELNALRFKQSIKVGRELRAFERGYFLQLTVELLVLKCRGGLRAAF